MDNGVRGSEEVFRSAEGSDLPAFVAEVLAVVDTRHVTEHHPALHLQFGHQGIRRAFLDTQQLPHLTDGDRTVCRQVIQNNKLRTSRLVFR